VGGAKGTVKNDNGLEDELRENIDAAHRDALGHGMPATWTERIRTEIADGDPTLLLDIDAKAIHAGRRRTPTGRTFGLGWVLVALRDARARRQALAPKAPDPMDVAAGQAELARRKKVARHFKDLPLRKRNYYIDQARASWTGRAPSDDHLQTYAAEIAWRSLNPEPVAEPATTEEP